jgi:hypothetical protein
MPKTPLGFAMLVLGAFFAYATIAVIAFKVLS